MGGGLQALIVTTVTALVVGAIMESAKRSPPDGGPEVFTVRQSRGALAAGIVCMVVFAAFLVFSVISLGWDESMDPDELYLIYGGFSFFFLLGLFVTIYAARFEIRVDNGRIEYTPPFGRTEIIRHTDIAYVDNSPMKLKAYDAWHHKIFVLDGPVKNRAALENWLSLYSVSHWRDKEREAAARRSGKRRVKEYLPRGARKKSKRMRKASDLRREHFMNAPPSLPENLEELMLPLRKTSIRLKPGSPSTPCVTGRSKFGGQPDLPPDFEWDYFEGEAPEFNEDASFKMVKKPRPLAFLLQLNCQEIRMLWPESPLPRQGLLSFFYELETMLWGPERLGDIGYVRVHYFERTDELVSTPHPEDLSEHFLVPQHPIFLGREVSLPGFDVFSRDKEFERTMSNIRVYNEARERLGQPKNARGELGLGSRIFGWAESIQNDVFDDFTEVWLKGRVDPELELERMGGKPEAGWELLLQLDSEEFDEMGAGGVMFGDMGSLYFGIRSDDLRAGRFDSSWFTLQCY